MELDKITKEVKDIVEKIAVEVKDLAKEYGGFIVLGLIVVYIFKKIK